MKPALLLPPTLLVGIALGWFLKPAPATPQQTPPATTQQTPAPRPPSPAPIDPPAPAPTSTPRPFPQRDHTLPANFTEAANARAKERDEAKLARLVEALSLTPEQTEKLLASIEAARKAPEPNAETGFPGPAEIIASTSATGEAIKKALDELLSEEQQTAMAELANRIQSNRIESSTEREIADVQDLVDLSPEQRDLLRQRLRAVKESRTVPPEIDLILDSSPLPVGPGAITEQGYETLRQLASIPVSRDPAETHRHLIEQQRADLDARLARYADILTPAQLQRFKVEIDAQRGLLDLMAPPTP